MQKFLFIFFFIPYILTGCSGQLMKTALEEDYVAPPADQITPAELFAAEKTHGARHPYYVPGIQKTESRFVQNVNAMAYRRFALRFADQYPTQQRDGTRMLNNTLDVANVGMHIASGATLGPVWLSLVDYDELAFVISKEKRFLEMPGIAIFLSSEQLPGPPSTIPQVTDAAGELFVQSPACHYHSYPKIGAFGLYIEGIEHSRNLMCGEPNPRFVSASAFGNADITTIKTAKDSNLSFLFGENQIVSTFFWLPLYSNWPVEIDTNMYNGTYRTPEYTQGIEGYKALKPFIPDEAYAVFTGPDKGGDWKIFVAHNGQIAAFDPPWTEGFKQADNGQLIDDI